MTWCGHHDHSTTVRKKGQMPFVPPVPRPDGQVVEATYFFGRTDRDRTLWAFRPSVCPPEREPGASGCTGVLTAQADPPVDFPVEVGGSPAIEPRDPNAANRTGFRTRTFLIENVHVRSVGKGLGEQVNGGEHVRTCSGVRLLAGGPLEGLYEAGCPKGGGTTWRCQHHAAPDHNRR